MKRLHSRLTALPLTLRWSAVGALAAVALWGSLLTVAVVVVTVAAVADGEISAALESGVQGVAPAVVMTVAVGAVGGTLGLAVGLVDRGLGHAVVRSRSARRPALVASLTMAGFLVLCSSVLLRLTASGSGPLVWVVVVLAVVPAPLVVCVRRYRRLETLPSHSADPLDDDVIH